MKSLQGGLLEDLEMCGTGVNKYDFYRAFREEIPKML